MSTVTAANIVLGPATVYVGAFEAAEPADTDVGSAPSSAAWTDIGATEGGVKVTVKDTTTQIVVDQINDPVGSRVTGRECTFETTMSETTLANLMYALNDGTAGSGSGYTSFEPSTADSSTTPTYRALIIDGPAPGSNKNRRVIIRKVLSVDGIEMEWKKDGQAGYKVKWLAHYVSTATKPWKWVDET